MKRVHFNEVRNNNIRTFFLILLFFIIIILLGWLIGFLFDNPYVGIGFTLFGGIIYTLVVWFAGGNMILKVAGAKEVSKKEYPHLYHTVEGLSLAAGIPTPKCYVIDTPAMNAFATGRDLDNSAVAVTTGLMNKLNREELEGVIAHEIAHIKNRDIRTMMMAAILTGVIVLLADVLFRMALFSGGGNNDGRSRMIILVVAIVFLILSPIISELVKLALSRKREYAADAQAAVLTRNPRGLANALKKISGDGHETPNATGSTAHLYISNPYNKKRRWKNLFSTHPPTDERIKRLEEM